MQTEFDYHTEYRKLHQNRNTFQGMSILPHVDSIAELVRRTKPRHLLDYGSGKGHQYKHERVHERWGGMYPILYDVGVKFYIRRPKGTFDGIICTDVMEHIARNDVPAVLEDIMSFSSTDRDAFVFFSIACRPARKLLTTGQNAHLTVETPAWWSEQIAKHARPGLFIKTVYMP